MDRKSLLFVQIPFSCPSLLYRYNEAIGMVNGCSILEFHESMVEVRKIKELKMQMREFKKNKELRFEKK